VVPSGVAPEQARLRAHSATAIFRLRRDRDRRRSRCNRRRARCISPSLRRLSPRRRPANGGNESLFMRMHGGIRTGRNNGAIAHHVIVLAIDPVLRRDGRPGEQRFEIADGVFALRDVIEGEARGLLSGKLVRGPRADKSALRRRVLPRECPRRLCRDATIMRPVSVTTPISAQGKSHLSKMRCTSASCPRFTMMSMRSCDSLSMIS
jgi:hypothetical protein